MKAGRLLSPTPPIWALNTGNSLVGVCVSATNLCFISGQFMREKVNRILIREVYVRLIKVTIVSDDVISSQVLVAKFETGKRRLHL